MSLNLTLSDEKTKELLTEVIVDLMQSRRELFHEIVLEALEDVGLANAINEDRAGDYVPESEVMSILNGNAT